MNIFNTDDFFDCVVCQDANALRDYFTPGAFIYWHNSNEQFTAEEYIRANCEYPGTWHGTVERVENTGAVIIAVAKVWDETLAFRVTSFITLSNDKICRLDEYWGDIGPAPAWRADMEIGKRIGKED